MIVLGDTNVGKTCLLQRYLTGEFGDAVPVRYIMSYVMLLYVIVSSHRITENVEHFLESLFCNN